MKTQTNLISLVLVVLCTFGTHTAFAQCTASLFAGGDGSEANPYQINTPQRLQNLNKCLGSDYIYKYYVLTSDINLSSYLTGSGYNGGAGWEPIGNSYNNSFQGKFNGNGYKVSGLWINRPTTDYVGLFGYVGYGVYYEGEIKNIGVEIDNAKGGVKGGNYVGGLLGYNDNRFPITNSFSTGNVSGDKFVGGLVGFMTGDITNSFATGSVTGDSYVGGLVGFCSEPNRAITNSFATGNVSGNRYVGGLAGQNGYSISNSYATGNVTGDSYVGGLIGYNNTSTDVSNSYAIGKVSGSSSVGGLAGSNNFSYSITNSYYNKETAKQTDTGKGIGKTTTEMKMQSTYSGWNFSTVWTIVNSSNTANLNNGYPILQWQLQNTPIVSYISPTTYTGSAIKPTFTVTLNKTVLTENSNYTVSYSSNIKAGTAKITITGVGSYSYLGLIEAYFTINPKPVTITNVIANDKEYDGTTTTTVAGTATINGKIGSDVVTINNGTASFNNKNVGIGKPVTFSGFSLSGTDAGNYTLSSQPASVTANITAKPVTITGRTASNKVYDGTTTATIAGTSTVNGKVGSDNVSVNNGTASFEDKDVGNGKTVTFSGFSLSGTDAGNYTLSSQPANVTANITAKSITLTGLSASSKVYDGTTTATVTGTPVVNGIIGDDEVIVTFGTASFANKNIGTSKTVTFSGFSLSGANAGNYTLSAQPASVTANITAKRLTITDVSAIDRTYNGTTTVELTGGMLNGVVSDDAVNFILGSGTVATPDVGSGKAVTTNITLIGTGISNYTLTQPTGITVTISTVTAKPLTITGVTAVDRDYDGTTIVELTGGILNGVTSGDVVSFVLGSGTIATPDAGKGKAVTTNITLAGANASNYILTQPTGITVTINAAIIPPSPNMENPKIGKVIIQTTPNAILLSNLPKGAKVEVYNLQGKQIHSAYSGNSKILKILVQTKGMYIVKTTNQTMRVMVR